MRHRLTVLALAGLLILAAATGGTEALDLRGVSTPLLLGDGTAAAPTYSFIGGTNTGTYRDAGTGNLIFSVMGGARVAMNSSNALIATQIAMSYATQDLLLSRDAAHTLQLGMDAAAPAAQTLKGPDATGAGPTGGATLNLQGGAPAGAGAYGPVRVINSTLSARIGIQTLAGAGTVTLCEGHLVRVTAAGVVVLPSAATTGQHCAVVSTAANVVSVDVASVADTMTLNGTALAAGNRATSDGTAGAELACVADLANSWRCRAVLATWVDGGA